MENVLGNRIRFLREERNLSQVNMAKQLSISNVQLNRYESGARQPDPEMLLSIADFFHVTTDYLLGRSSRILEEAPSYMNAEDIILIQQIKQSPELLTLVKTAISDPDNLKRLIKLWAVLHDPV